MEILETTDVRIDNILQDIEIAQFDNGAKRLVAEKYNINSRKIGDIEKFLYNLADSYRKEHKTYSKQDWTIWNRKWDVPYSYKKIKDACAGEPIEWIDFCIEVTSKKAYPKDKRNEYFYKIKREMLMSKDNELENLYNSLTILTFPFKEKLYDRFITYEQNKFDFLKSQEFTEEEKRNGDKLYKAYLRMKAISMDFNWELYKKRIDDEFESSFTSNIKVIAKRIRQHNIKHNNLKLITINEDPKFFEMILRDNQNRNIYCRSILAAEYSEKVTTHYRFIITIKNK